MVDDVEITHNDHISKIKNFTPPPSPQKQAVSVTSEKKPHFCIRFFRCILCGIGTFLLVLTITLVTMKLTGVFDHEDYTFSAITDNPNLCNGLESNCGWRVNEIMFPAVHNAMSSKEDRFLEWNNILPLEQALEAGFRALFVDTCECPVVGISLCHNTCAAGYRNVNTVFTAVLNFLTLNPREVLIIEIQSGSLSLQDLFAIIYAIPGFTDIVYEHTGGQDSTWPLMSELIDSNKRLIFFQHDGGSCKNGQCPIGVLDTYVYAFETPYESKGIEGLMNVTETCLITRGDYRNAFFISNHFAGDSLGLPDYDVSVAANSVQNLQIRLDACHDMVERRVNILAVDFWSVGDVLPVVKAYNEALGFATAIPTMSPTGVPTKSPMA